MARSLALRDCDLLLCDEDGESLLGLREELAALPCQVQLFQGDAGRPEHRRELLHFLRLAAAKPDILCFQATRQLQERRLGAPPSDVRAQLDAGLLALDDLLRSGLLGDMLKEGNGYILASMRASALSPAPGQAVNAALGAGLKAYLDSLTRELAGSGVSATLHILSGGQERLLARPQAKAPREEGAQAAEQGLKALFARRGQVGLPRWQSWLRPRLNMPARERGK